MRQLRIGTARFCRQLQCHNRAVTRETEIHPEIRQHIELGGCCDIWRCIPFVRFVGALIVLYSYKFGAHYMCTFFFV